MSTADLNMVEVTDDMILALEKNQDLAITGGYNFGLCFGIPVGGQVPIEFWLHYQKVIKHMPRGITFNTFIVPRRPIDEARSIILKVAIQSKAKYLIMMDDDSLPPFFFIRRMVELADKYDYDAITGVEWPKGTFTRPTIYSDVETAGLLPGKDWNFGDVFTVPMAGFPLCLIRVDALKIYVKYMMHRHPDNMLIHAGEWVAGRGEGKDPQEYKGAEDFYFWYHWNKCGLKLVCDTFCCCDHVDRSTGYIYPTQDVVNDIFNEKGVNKRFYMVDDPFTVIKPNVEIRQPPILERDEIAEKILLLNPKPKEETPETQKSSDALPVEVL